MIRNDYINVCCYCTPHISTPLGSQKRHKKSTAPHFTVLCFRIFPYNFGILHFSTASKFSFKQLFSIQERGKPNDAPGKLLQIKHARGY